MTRIIGITIFTVVALLTAQASARQWNCDRQAVALLQGRDKRSVKGDGNSGQEKKLPMASTGENAEEIVKRLNQRFEEAEFRLSEKDPRGETQKIQVQIIRDLDDLINQKNANGSNSAGADNRNRNSRSSKS